VNNLVPAGTELQFLSIVYIGWEKTVRESKMEELLANTNPTFSPGLLVAMKGGGLQPGFNAALPLVSERNPDQER